MVPWIAAVLLGATLHSQIPGDMVCETRQVPRQISRNVQTLDTVAFCYSPRSAEQAGTAQLDRLRAACELLVTAYGPDEGRARCRELIERSGTDLEQH